MYRHSYDNVVETIVWKTMQEDLARYWQRSWPNSRRMNRLMGRISV
jgi:hypothetical protein